MTNLDDLFVDLMAQLPVEPETRFTLTPANCVCPPSEIDVPQLRMVAWPLGHVYGDSSRYDLIHFFADKATYRRLGLLLFASVFHPNREIRLHPSHPESNIVELKIDCPGADPLDPGLHGLALRSMAYGYSPEPVESLHPFWRETWRLKGGHEIYAGRASYYFPFLNLTNEHGCCGGEDQFRKRNFVEGFGGFEETVPLAALLLDIGLPQTELTEFCLESPSGNWSVAIGSAEACFWVGYDYH